MKNKILFSMLLIGLLSTSLSYAQQGKMGKGQHPKMMMEKDGSFEDRMMGAPDKDPLARIQKFIDNPKISNDIKAKIVEEFKVFSEESFNLRLKHEEKIYKWRKERMEKQHIARLEKLKEQNELKNSLNFSSPESVAEFKEKMKAYREEGRGKRHEMMEEHHQEIKKIKDEFHQVMKERADAFRTKIKELVKNGQAKS